MITSEDLEKFQLTILTSNLKNDSGDKVTVSVKRVPADSADFAPNTISSLFEDIVEGAEVVIEGLVAHPSVSYEFRFCDHDNNRILAVV